MGQFNFGKRGQSYFELTQLFLSLLNSSLSGKILRLGALYPSLQIPRAKSRRKGLITMKVLLIKDVYKLGHAGDVKRVADGYGRNFLLTKSLAVLATPGALKQIVHIKNKATARRAVLNNELGAIADQINGLVFNFSSRAGETGKLYGSITSQQITDALNARLGAKIDRHQVEVEPVRTLGEHKARIRLTVDLNPEIKIVVYREGEGPASATPAATTSPAAAAPAAPTAPAAAAPAAKTAPAAALPAAVSAPAPEKAD